MSVPTACSPACWRLRLAEPSRWTSSTWPPPRTRSRQRNPRCCGWRRPPTRCCRSPTWQPLLLLRTPWVPVLVVDNTFVSPIIQGSHRCTTRGFPAMASPRGRWKASGPWIQLQQSCLARRVCEETRLFALAVAGSSGITHRAPGHHDACQQGRLGARPRAVPWVVSRDEGSPARHDDPVPHVVTGG